MRNGKYQHVSPEEADRRMASAGEIPFSNQEIEAMVRSATRGGSPPPRKLRLMPHHGTWNKLAAVLLAAAIVQGMITAFPGDPGVRSLETAGIPARPLSPWSNRYSDPQGGHLAPRESNPAFPDHPEQP